MKHIRNIILSILTVFICNITFAYSVEELNKFGEQIESSLSSGNPYYINLKFNADYMLERIFSMYSASNSAEYNAGFSEGMAQSFDLGDMLIKDFQQSGSFEFFGAKMEAKQSHLLFRLVNTTGIDYYRFNVEQEEGNMILTDLYVFSTGTYLSETIANAYSKHLISINSSGNIKPTSVDNINSLILDGKHKKALKQWEILPANIKMQKELLQTGIMLSEGSTVEQFNNAFDLFNRYYPNEPGKFLIPLNGLVHYKKFKEALTLIDSLDYYLDTDPTLNIIRAELYSMMGNLDKAVEMYQSLIIAKPEFEIGYYGLLELHLQQKSYEEATALLDRMIYEFNSYKEAFLPILINHPEYLQTNIFQNWVNK